MLFISIFFIHLCVLVLPGSDFLLNSRTRLTGNKKNCHSSCNGYNIGDNYLGFVLVVGITPYFSSIFSIIHFGSNPFTVFFIFIMITLETLIWFLFVGLAFSHSGIQAFYQIYKSRIDRLSACVFIMFACSIIFKLFVK